MKAAAKNGTSYESVQARHQYPTQCPLMADGSQMDELQPLDMSNFIAPTLVLVFFMGLAISTRAFRVSSNRIQAVRQEGIQRHETVLQTIRRVSTHRNMLPGTSKAAGGNAAERGEAEGKNGKPREGGEAKSEANGGTELLHTSGHTDDYTSGVYTRVKGDRLRSFTTAGLHRHNAEKLRDMERALVQITRKLEGLQPPAKPEMSRLEA